MKELIDLDKELSLEIKQELNADLEEHLNSNLNSQSSQVEILWNKLLNFLIKNNSGKVRKRLKNLNATGWPIVYDYIDEIMGAKDSHMHGWWVASSILEVIALRKDKKAIPLILDLLSLDPNPYFNNWTRNLIKTGEALLGKQNFLNKVSEAFGYNYGDQLKIWKTEYESKHNKS